MADPIKTCKKTRNTSFAESVVKSIDHIAIGQTIDEKTLVTRSKSELTLTCHASSGSISFETVFRQRDTDLSSWIDVVKRFA